MMFDRQQTASAEPTAALINLTTDRSFPLTNPRVLIGRATNCDIVLDDLNASRTHARSSANRPTFGGSPILAQPMAHSLMESTSPRCS